MKAQTFLTRVQAPELYHECIRAHFHPYCTRNSFVADEVLSEYLLDILEKSGMAQKFVEFSANMRELILSSYM